MINNHGVSSTTNSNEICGCNFYVVLVSTSIGENNRPCLKPLQDTSEMVGKVISKGVIIVYESTVYLCDQGGVFAIAERVSGMKLNVDFFADYSPERINPCDKLHTVEKIK